MKISVEILTLTSIKRENSVDKLFLLVFNVQSFNILKHGVLNVKRCKIDNINMLFPDLNETDIIERLKQQREEEIYALHRTAT